MVPFANCIVGSFKNFRDFAVCALFLWLIVIIRRLADLNASATLPGSLKYWTWRSATKPVPCVSPSWTRTSTSLSATIPSLALLSWCRKYGRSPLFVTCSIPKLSKSTPLSFLHISLRASALWSIKKLQVSFNSGESARPANKTCQRPWSCMCFWSRNARLYRLVPSFLLQPNRLAMMNPSSSFPNCSALCFLGFICNHRASLVSPSRLFRRPRR